MITIYDTDYDIDREFFLEKLEEISRQLEIKGTITIKLGNEEEIPGHERGIP